MEYTVDGTEKSAVSRLAHGKILGRLMAAHLSATEPAAGVSTVTLTMKDSEADDAVETEEVVTLGVFDDAAKEIPSTTAVIQNPTKGEILYGTGYPVVKLETEVADDESQCVFEVAKSTSGRVYVGVMVTVGSSIVSCKDSIAIDFP